jgi:glycosyltransferase involved in cell wall biosynthesis
VQLEWWTHPAILKALCSQTLPAMRLIIWCHVSGLFNPIVPQKLILAANRFLFTSPCSYDAKEIKELPFHQIKKISVVSSCGGFNHLSKQKMTLDSGIAVGYFGSLNFSKLHPDYIHFLKAVKMPGFKVKMIGDVVNKKILEKQCWQLGCASKLEFYGYSIDPGEVLASLNVLAYLLNPQHYGTTENALLEAMAMGIVPIVLDNPAERYIVDHLQTGFIVRSGKEFNDALQWLDANADERLRISKNAARYVRKRFCVENLVSSINAHYKEIMSEQKKNVSFTSIFGKKPADWFLSCQSSPALFEKSKKMFHDGVSSHTMHGLFEKTKGSVFHFLKYFPEDRKLNLLSSNLKQNCML